MENKAPAPFYFTVDFSHQRLPFRARVVLDGYYRETFVHLARCLATGKKVSSEWFHEAAQIISRELEWLSEPDRRGDGSISLYSMIAKDETLLENPPINLKSAAWKKLVESMKAAIAQQKAFLPRLAAALKQLEEKGGEIRSPSRKAAVVSRVVFENHRQLTIPPSRQPNGYTCGAAAAHMAIEYWRPGVFDCDVNKIGSLAGTNPRTGTTHVEMARALNYGMLPFVRHLGGSSESALRWLEEQIVTKRAPVMLRTGYHGMLHWVVVSGFDGRGKEPKFTIECPSAGRQIWSDSELLERWSTRDHDAFAVHLPMKLILPWTQTTRDFLGHHRVVESESYGPFERGAIAAGEDALRSAQNQVEKILNSPEKKMLFTYDDVDFYRGKNALAAVRGESVVGLVTKTIRIVRPEFRGKGYGAALSAATELDAGYIHIVPSSYSVGGFRSKIRAHKLILDWASVQSHIRPETIRPFEPESVINAKLHRSKGHAPETGEVLDLPAP